MLDCIELYKVSIKSVSLKVSRNYSLYINIETVTSDLEQKIINVCYYFTNRAKYFSFEELKKILDAFELEVDENNFLECLSQLKGKEVYLRPIPCYKDKYQIFKNK